MAPPVCNESWEMQALRGHGPLQGEGRLLLRTGYFAGRDANRCYFLVELSEGATFIRGADATVTRGTAQTSCTARRGPMSQMMAYPQ